jgi:isocitrate dehydrogenase
MANPSGLLLGGVMMLVHIGQPDVAERVHNAWLRTIEEGIHTYDVYRRGIETGVSKQEVGTREFADAVIARLGKQPETLKPVHYAAGNGIPLATYTPRPPAQRTLVGVDVFVFSRDKDPNVLGAGVENAANGDGLRLSMISNRGQKVYPNGSPETFCTDHWRCRFLAEEKGTPITPAQIISLVNRIHAAGFDFIKTENLYYFDGEPGFTMGQGE